MKKIEDITRYRVLNIEGQTIETTSRGTDIINGIEVIDIVTYWSKPISQSFTSIKRKDI